MRTFCPILSVDVKHANSTLVTHTLLGDADNLGVIFAESYSFDCCWEFPGIQTFSGWYLPKFHGIICRARYHEFWLIFRTNT